MKWILLAVMLAAGAAQAAPYKLTFRNPDTSRAYTSLRTPWGIVAAPCAPGATCSVVLDLPAGPRKITAEATDGTAWSGVSNLLSATVLLPPADCLLAPACRFDFDGDGRVGGTDFAAFASAFGLGWFVP